MRAETIPPDGSDLGPGATESRADAPTGRGPWRAPLGLTLALAALGAALLLLALWSVFVSGDREPPAVDVEAAVAEALDSMAPLPAPAVSAQIYQAVLPSLVVVQTNRDGEEEDGFGMGAGVVVNDDASVLTALHVVEGATEIRLGFADGARTTAYLANADPERDIAVLMPESPPGLVLPATIGSAGAMRVGDEVFAVGNPLGLVGSLSSGVVSGFDRESTPPGREEPLRGLIQFDAAVNPGSSGGPLLNRRGQVVGIVTGLINPTEQDFFIGIGFAVPIDAAVSAAGGPAQ